MPGHSHVFTGSIEVACSRSRDMVPVKSLIAKVPVVDMVSRPRIRCPVPLRPRRFAIGVIFHSVVLLPRAEI